MARCPNCKEDSGDGTKFCRLCGFRLSPEPAPPVATAQPVDGEEEAQTLRLSQGTMPVPPQGEQTSRIAPTKTAEPLDPISQQYLPRDGYLIPSAPRIPEYTVPQPTRISFSLGDWLARGWRAYADNALTMSTASFIGLLICIVTGGLMTGPILLGLYRISFKALRGERPSVGDMLEFEGQFLQSFLAGLIFGALYFVISVAFKSGAFSLLTLIANPFLVIGLALTIPMILHRRVDVMPALSSIGRLLFSRDAFMWWIVGLVFSTINLGGLMLCGVGIFLTFPWMVASGAAMYGDVLGDDPNRTLH